MAAAPDTTNHPRLDELLLQCQHRRDVGEPVTPEELCAGCPDLLEDLRNQIEAQLGGSGPHSATTVREGDTRRQKMAPSDLPRVPGYEVLEMLGRGGMGVVFKARQDGTDRLVAVKMLSSIDATREDDCTRFRREARALARISHPNIVQIYEVGDAHPADANLTVPFFSMEYVAGGTLSQCLDGKPLPPDESAALVETLALAMHAAHQ